MNFICKTRDSRRAVCAILAICAILTASAAEAVTPVPATQTIKPPVATQKAPAQASENLVDLEVKLLDGKTWRYSAHRKNYLVLNYWATWCKPCIKEMPDFQALSQNKQISVLGLAYDETEMKELSAFVTRLKVTYPVSQVDVYAPMPKPLTVPKGLPFTLIYAPGGVLLKKVLAPISKAEVETVIAAHRKSKS